MQKMTIHLSIWRQKNSTSRGYFEDFTMDSVSPDMSFLEMLDILNETLIKSDKEPISFDSDCREGICGACGLVINGVPHSEMKETCTCQLHMRHFKDGQHITIEPFRAKAFPVIKDLVVDRSAMDRIISKGGYTSVKTGSAPEANNILVEKAKAEQAMDAAACIGCGACIAACPNASASLFAAAKISQYALLPQGQLERKVRARQIIEQMDEDNFGNCSNYGECEAVCPKGISITNIARMKREYMRTLMK